MEEPVIKVHFQEIPSAKQYTKAISSAHGALSFKTSLIRRRSVGYVVHDNGVI